MSRAPALPFRGPAAGASVVLAAASLILAWPAAVAAQESTEVRTARRDLGRVERLNVEVEYAAGRVTVDRADPGYLYQKNLRYDASRFEPTRDWSRDDGTARLRLGLESLEEDGRWFRWDGLDIDLNLDGLRDLDTRSGSLDLGLSRSVPTDLSMRIGAAETELRLGGIPLTSVTLETGASDTEVSFDRPNPARMERMEIRSGAASFRARQLGNARFAELDIEGGVGDVHLDFRGRWERDAEASIDLGLGSLELTFPPELGVRVRRESFLSSFEAPAEFRRTDSGYVSDNWSSAEHRLTLDVSAAFGSVEIDVRD